MPDDIELRARIVPEIDKQSLQKEGDSAAKSLEGKLRGLKFKDMGIPKGIGSQFKGMFSGAKQKIGSIFGGKEEAPEGSGKKKGLLGGILGGEGGGLTNIFGKGAGGMLGKFAAITIVLEGIFKVVQKGVQFLAESSPLLRSTFKLLRFAVMLIFKPIGDMLGRVLRPLALWLMAVARKTRDKMADAMKSGDFAGALAIWLGALFEEVGTAIYDSIVGAFSVENLEGFGAWLFTAITTMPDWGWDVLKGVGQFLLDTIKGISEWGWDVMSSLGSFILEQLKGVVDWGWSALKDTGKAVLGAIVNALAGIEIPGLGKIFKGFLQDWFPWAFESVDPRWSALKDTGKAVLGAIVNALAGIENAGPMIFPQVPSSGVMIEMPPPPDWFPTQGGSPFGDPEDFYKYLPAYAEGGIVTGPTVGLFGEHEPEAVIPLSKLNSYMPRAAQASEAPSVNNYNFNVSGNVYDGDKFRRAVESIIDRYDIRVKRA